MAGAQNALLVVAEAAGHSMVELQATTSHGTVVLVGVAVAEGGLVATTVDLLGGLRRIDMVGPGGTLQAASVVATDKASDVALVDVPKDLPVATFADDTSLQTGAPDLALTFVPAGGNAIALDCTQGAVAGVGGAIASGPASTMPSITSSPVAPSPIAGEPLLSADGSVLGILYDADPGTSPATFLPAALSWAWPTTCAPRTGWSTVGWGCRAPTCPVAPAPRWPRCSPVDRPRAACRWASSSWP